MSDWRRRCARRGWRPDDIPADPPGAYGRKDFSAIGGWYGFLSKSPSSGQSYPERLLRYLILKALDPHTDVPERPVGLRVGDDTPTGRRIGCDIVVPTLLWVIEIDGVAWHRDHDHRDRTNTDALRAAGYQVIRLRDQGLTLLHPIWDHNVKVDDDPHKLAIAALDHLTRRARAAGATATAAAIAWQRAHDAIVVNPENPLLKAAHDWAFAIKPWRPLAEAAAWAQAQGVTSWSDWRRRCARRDWRPDDIPANPPDAYGSKDFNAIGGWGGFLGTGRVAPQNRTLRPLAEAAAWAQAQGVAGASDWRRRCARRDWRPDDIPANPPDAYDRKDFNAIGGWGGFLGTGRVATQNRTLRPLAEAAAWAQAQGVTSQSDWFRRCARRGWRPDDIPAGPSNAYGRKDFNAIGGWGGFLGTGRVATQNRTLRPLAEAAAWAQAQGVTSWSDWFRRCARRGWRPDDIPANPPDAYGSKDFNAIGGWGGFLGTGRVAPQNRTFRPLAEAAAWAQAQGVASVSDWRRRCARRGWLPADIPAGPPGAYGPDAFNAIGGWGGFLGTGRVAPQNRTWRPLAEAAAWAQAQGVTSQSDWSRCRTRRGWRPDDIPANPPDAYGSKDFNAIGGWGGFLGTGRVATRNRTFRPTRKPLPGKMDTPRARR